MQLSVYTGCLLSTTNTNKYLLLFLLHTHNIVDNAIKLEVSATTMNIFSETNYRNLGYFTFTFRVSKFPEER